MVTFSYSERGKEEQAKGSSKPALEERGEGRRKQIEGFLRLVFSSSCLPHFFSSVGFAMPLVKQKEACLHR